jgi:hypothetical protein
VTKSYSILGIDGNHVSVSELDHGDGVVLSIQHSGRIATVRLSPDQFDDLCGTKYSLSYRVTPPTQLPSTLQLDLRVSPEVQEAIAQTAEAVEQSLPERAGLRDRPNEETWF